MPAVFHDPAKNISKFGLALGFAMPFCKHRRRNFDVPAQLLCGMSPKKKAVEKGGFSLRKVKIVKAVLDFLRGNDLWHGGHDEKEAVYIKDFARQVVRLGDWCLVIHSPFLF